MNWQIDKFSRTFDKQYYLNAAEIAKELKVKIPPVHSWELLDKSFSFPRVRRYDDVQNNLEMLEHFQDNMNLNNSNQINVDRFIRVGKAVVSAFNEKYHDGEFSDPIKFNPRDEVKPSW